MNAWRWPLFLVFCITLFLLALKKAVFAAITWDEAFTYLEFIKTARLYPGAGGGMAANNHLLNTWISFLSTKLFGVSELTLRLGNLLFLAVYLVASSWLAFRSGNFLVSLTIFSLLNLNPYLFDFFTLSRGYGMAHSCLLLSIICLFKFNDSGQNIWLKLMLLISITGILAGAMLLPAFGLLYAAAFLIIPLVYKNGLQQPASWKQQVISAFKQIPLYMHLVYLASMLFVMIYLLLLQKFNAFLFGGNKGVIADTIFSVLKNSVYHSKFPFLFYAPLLMMTLLILKLKLSGEKIKVTDTSLAISKTIFAVFFTVTGVLILSGLLFWVLGTPLPSERTALYLYVLFAVLISLVLIKAGSQNFFYQSVCMISVSLLVLHFALTFNFKTYHDWKPDADASLMVNDLTQIIPEQHDVKIFSLASLELEMPLKFYLDKNDDLKNRLIISRISKPLKNADLYFLDRSDLHLSSTYLQKKDWARKIYPQGCELIYRKTILQ